MNFIWSELIFKFSSSLWSVHHYRWLYLHVYVSHFRSNLHITLSLCISVLTHNNTDLLYMSESQNTASIQFMGMFRLYVNRVSTRLYLNVWDVWDASAAVIRYSSLKHIYLFITALNICVLIFFFHRIYFVFVVVYILHSYYFSYS